MPIKINSSNPYSAIKTINHALNEISKTFGTDARQLQDMQAKLDLVLGEGATRINSKGGISVRNTASNRAGIAQADVAGALGNLPTASEYLEQAKERVRADRGKEDVSTSEAIEHEQKVDRVKHESERIRQILSDQKAEGGTISAMGYDELYDLIAGDFDDEQWCWHGSTYEPSSGGDWVDVSEDFFEGAIGSIERL